MDPVAGATTCLAVTSQYRNRIDQRMADTGGLSPVSITGEFARLGTELLVTTRFTKVDEVPLEELQATLLVYEDDVYFCCGPGGNSIWNGVVRVLYDQPVTLTATGVPVVVATGFELDPSWDEPNLHIVAYLQHPDTKEIYQAARITQQTTGVEEASTRSRVLAIAPNPTHGPLSVLFDLSAEEARTGVVLELLDVTGRRVEQRIISGLKPGSNVVNWDNSPTTPRQTGAYFVRIGTQQRTQVGRFVQVE